MRDPDRLDKFYDTIKWIHKNKFPDWRFGQLMINFFGWVWEKKQIDPFFPEENRMLEFFEEFGKEENSWVSEERESDQTST